MLATTLTENLSKALSIASRFTGGKVRLPVLANILIKAEKNRLNICATNLETSVSINIGAKVEKEGQITVPGKTINDLVGNLPHGPVTLNEENEKILIKNPSFESVILGVNASDYPSIPQKTDKKGFKLDSSLFVNVLSKTLFSVSVDETRPVLTGILFIMKKDEITFVSTDGFRLSSKRVEVKNLGLEDEQRFILPKNTMNELLRLCADVEQIEFEFSKEENQAVFTIGNIVLSSRIIQGDFPDFERIVPKNPTLKIEIDREEMLRAVKLASVFARESASVIKVGFDKSGIEISAESAKSGNQKMHIDAKLDISEELIVAYNYRFVEELLNCIEAESIVVELTDANVPGLFKDPDDPNYFHIIMPIKLSS